MPAIRKPNELKVLEGRRVSNESPTLAPLDEHNVPESLGERGRELWERVVDAYKGTKVLQRTDHAALEALCLLWDTYHEAQADIRARGVLVASAREDDALIRNPAVMVANAALERWHRLAAAFGLTPCDRARLDGGKVDSGPNVLEQLIAEANADRDERRRRMAAKS